MGAARDEGGLPAAVRPKSRPACSAQGEDRGVGVPDLFAIRRFEDQRVVIPSQPSGARDETDAQTCQTRQPGAKKRRGLHLFWEDTATGADEGFDPEVFAPLTQVGWSEGVDRAFERCTPVAIAVEECLQRFGVCEVESAASGEQKFTCGVRHAIVDRDGDARLRQNFGGGEAGRASADDDHMFFRKR